VLGRDHAYTTILKLLQIMTEKRLVQRRESGRLHVYTAAQSRERTQRRLVRDLVDRAFRGSAAQLVLHALATGKASPDELKEIRQLIEKHRGGR
jgi:predicted transcriptional regulator